MRSPAPPKTVEWPTWLVVFLVHAAWLALLVKYHALGAWLAAPLLVLVLTWHSSLCHEILHGHPTRIGWLNDLLAQLPLALMVPYFIFKESHLQHHRTAHLTRPGADPESFFTDPDAWHKQRAAPRMLARVNMTLGGRMLMGPGLALCRLLAHLGADLRAGHGWRIMQYVVHFSLAGAIVMLAERWFEVPFWHYLLLAYLSQSLLLVRSYFEHRPHPIAAQRTVIIDSCWPLRLLYLNNNYHAAHHDHPHMPWYQLPREYHCHRARYLQRNGHFYYRGYCAWLAHLFKPVAEPVHPLPAKRPR